MAHEPHNDAPWLRTAGFVASVHAAAIGDLPAQQLLARVCEDRRTQYRLWISRDGAGISEVVGECPAEFLRDVRKGEAIRPVVGDWVVCEPPSRSGDCHGIERVLPRTGQFTRRRAGQSGREQVLAANVDRAFLMTAVDGDFNPRRIERYASLALDARVSAVVVLSKVDLIDSDARAEIGARTAEVREGLEFVWYSHETGEGYEQLEAMLVHGSTTAVLGSSGVGKSTLINRFVGSDVQAVGEVRRDGKGRHTTSTRHLRRARGGGLIIDTPGLRELGLWAAREGLEQSFADVAALASHCRFDDCTHAVEPGCAVRAAVAEGQLSADRAANFVKLSEETLQAERRERGTRAARNKGSSSRKSRR